MIFSIKWGQSLIQMWRVILINEFMVQDSDIRGVWNEIHDIVNPGVKTYSSLLIFIMLCSMTLNWIPHSLINSSQLTLQCTNKCNTQSLLCWPVQAVVLTCLIFGGTWFHSPNISNISHHSSLKISHSTKYLIPKTSLKNHLTTAHSNYLTRQNISFHRQFS